MSVFVCTSTGLGDVVQCEGCAASWGGTAMSHVSGQYERTKAARTRQDDPDIGSRSRGGLRTGVREGGDTDQVSVLLGIGFS